MNKLQKQLQYNVEEILDEYYNGMLDYGEEKYPQMTVEQCRKYVLEDVYDMMSNGHGSTIYSNGICENLKFLGNDYIYAVIDEYAKGLEIVKGL